MKNELITFKDGTLELNVPVSWEQETVWITRNQMAELFDRDVKTIGKHINNALKEELDNSTVANFATVESFNSSFKALLICLPMVLTSLSNNCASWLRFNHTVSLSGDTVTSSCKSPFTNLIARPDAPTDDVKLSVNNMLKAITASLLMEQVLAPSFKFKPRFPDDKEPPKKGELKIRGFKTSNF